MSDKITVKDVISKPMSFDPMTLDTSELKELSSSIPKDGNIDINIAEQLATKFLRGADVCSELVAIATTHVAKMDAEKKRTYGYAASVKATQAGMKTGNLRGWYADQDADYIVACNKHAEAHGFLKWINGKYDSFLKAHYLCKKMLDRAYPHEKSGSWNGNGIEVNNDTENTAW